MTQNRIPVRKNIDFVTAVFSPCRCKDYVIIMRVAKRRVMDGSHRPWRHAAPGFGPRGPGVNTLLYTICVAFIYLFLPPFFRIFSSPTFIFCPVKFKVTLLGPMWTTDFQSDDDFVFCFVQRSYCEWSVRSCWLRFLCLRHHRRYLHSTSIPYTIMPSLIRITLNNYQ